MTGSDKSTGLQSVFSPLGIWAFSIGTSIGWGSFIVTCNVYLQKAGVLGTAFGLLFGMAVILVITWNLQYMIQARPDAGGIYTFEKKTGGKDLGFLAAWFVLLTYMAILWANITSVPLFARFFLGDVFRFGFHYTIFGYEVWFGEVLLSVAALLIIGDLCSRSTRLSVRLVIVASLTFTVGFMVCAGFAIARHGDAYSYAPMYVEGSSAFAQIVLIAAISPWAFIGYENISHFSEEYSFPAKKVRRILLWSVLGTTALYVLVSLLSISAYPPEYGNWLEYIRDMGKLSGLKAVPAFYVANHYLGATGVVVLMLALFGVILTSLIGNMMALSRLLYAAGREGEAPQALKQLNGQGIPVNAIYCVVAVSLLIPFLGRTAIGWIVDVTTLGATIVYGLICHAVYRHAKAQDRKLEKCTGIIGFVLMSIFLILLLTPGLLAFHAMETESYVLFILWSVLGLFYFRKLVRRDLHRGYGKSYLVWIVLLMLILFASMMWVHRATEQEADRVVGQVLEYHMSHPSGDSDIHVREARTAFLQMQADRISSTNTMHTWVSLALCILAMLIMLNNYRDTRDLGERLSAAQEAEKAARKIAELRASLVALLNNIPGPSFSKDAKTGVYLACNQAFAEYAHKRTPDEVIGLTDAEIFDAATAAHFVQDDKMALSMDEPYIFYEDVLDPTGNQRQFQTTKLKFIDDAGRLCTLGLCLDVTELVRIRRENVTTKEAYEKTRSAGIIYTHIAQTLARGYSDLYYINLETEEFIEYRTDDASGRLNEVRRGDHFFGRARIEANLFVHPDDKPVFVKAMDKRTLMDALDRNKVYVITIRLLSGKSSYYVTMKVSRMEDDERFIILGVTNVDEQMRQQKAVERAKEERFAYARLNALTGDFLCVYIIEPSGRYREYSATSGYETIALPKEGGDFFGDTRELAARCIHPGDLSRFLDCVTRENVWTVIQSDGIFTLTYRLMIRGKPTHVQLKAAMVREKEGPRLVVGVVDIDSHVRQEEEYSRRLAQAQSKANVDALTGVKNKHAYLDYEDRLNRRILDQENPEFAITILDVNDLKKVNDTEGHQAGDEYLRGACMIICNTFKHSPVFRIGGDEFAVISTGNDYARIEELLGKIADHNSVALSSGGIVIACGMARNNEHKNVAAVFELADQRMYDNKEWLKSNRG
jgi:diguanylate cyclase (GGDEF)-like protein